MTDTAKLNSIYSQLEKDFLQQLPQIPLWYNGAWFQGNTQYWQTTRQRHRQPEHPGHVERLHRLDDHGLRPGRPDAGPQTS